MNLSIRMRNAASRFWILLARVLDCFIFPSDSSEIAAGAEFSSNKPLLVAFGFPVFPPGQLPPVTSPAEEA